MKDLLGNDLYIGDSVVVAPKNYRGLVVATIKDMTPKMVRVQYVNDWNYTALQFEEYLVPPQFVAKI